MVTNEVPNVFQGGQNIKLAIRQVIGTSAKSANQFSIQGDVIAYTASGGVVVCKVDKECNKVISQRFFCANSSSSIQNSGNEVSSADAYLNMALNNRSNESMAEVRRDTYGFTLSTEPLIYDENNGVNNADFGLSSSSKIDVKSSSPSKLKDKVRSINCISLSPNRRLLAVGEVGYQPRILLFSLAPDLNPWPIASISEHSFGINSICFSQDLKFFCSLGLVNDRFLNVWKFTPNSISLQASNKCSSIINQIIWHENLIVTLGLRLIKVWEFYGEDNQSPKSKVLKGKNVLLGPVINSNFITADVLNTDEVLLVDDKSKLLLLKLNYSNLKLIPLESVGFNICSLWIDHEQDTVWFGTESNNIVPVKFGELKADTKKVSQPSNPSSPNKEKNKKQSILSLNGFNNDNFIILTNNEEIVLIDKAEKTEKILVSSLAKNLSGIKHCYLNDIVVFSCSGKVRIINENDNFKDVIDFNLPSTELISNSLTAMDMGEKCLALGDKLGNLFLLQTEDNQNYSLVYQTKAHSSSVNEISYFVFENYEIVVSISRDRMIQIHFKADNKWDILQTIPIHNANLLQICYHKEKIYVSSADRTISVHKFDLEDGKIKLYQEKIITLKSSPVYMSLFDNNLIVSTNDKNIYVFSTEGTYDQLRCLQLYNEKNNDILQVEMFTIATSILIASSSDKSLRAFNFFSGKELCVAWGQLEAILSLILKKNDELISITNDGCLFRWLLQLQTNVVENTPVENTLEVEENILPLYTKVTRKIIPTSPQKAVTISPLRQNQALQLNSDPQEKISSPVTTPTSPTPKLTAATLKRIEARKKATGNVTLKKQPVSPSKPQTPLKQLLRSLLPLKQNAFLPKNPNSASPSKPVTVINESGSPSPNRSYLRRDSMNKSPSPIKSNETDKIIRDLTYIEEFVRDNRISHSDKSRIGSKISNILELLSLEDELIENTSKLSLSDKTEGEKGSTEQLLENYSNRLIKLFEEKLNNIN